MLMSFEAGNRLRAEGVINADCDSYSRSGRDGLTESRRHARGPLGSWGLTDDAGARLYHILITYIKTLEPPPGRLRTSLCEGCGSLNCARHAGSTHRASDA